MGLALKFKVGRAVQVGQIKVTIAKIIGNQVQLDFEGPREIPISRVEVKRENESEGVTK